MDNKFISRDALRKRKARENETPSQHEARLAKQRESRRQKKARETTDQRVTRTARDNERKRVRLEMETDEQCKKRLNCYRERRTYLKNIANTFTNRDLVDKDLNQQQ